MPLTDYLCPDGQRIPIGVCLAEGGCRMGSRCATRSYLRLAASDRPWTGKPSTTQLINGTMLAYLKIKRDYAISPDSRAFMIHGTRGHTILEGYEDDCSLLETRFSGDDVDVTGISDVIETEDGHTILVDYKTSGSYKIAKCLGFTVKSEPTGEVYKSGKRKGEPKTIKVLVKDADAIDIFDWTMQLNKYRMLAERRKIKIDKLKIQCIARDGGTYIARSRGVFRNVYYFDIPILKDSDVDAYFERKATDLALALSSPSGWSRPCTARENWDGLRCSRYCEVAEFCSFGKYLKQQKEESEMPIKGLSDIRRLPRLGKIRLGIRKTAANGKEHPVEIDYFRLDPSTAVPEERARLEAEFERLFGPQPKRIKIMFPLPDVEQFFPQYYKRYGGSVQRCKGDGEEATCISQEYAAGLEQLGPIGATPIRVKCLGENCPNYLAKKCDQRGTLNICIPEMQGAGVWQIETGSFHGIVNVNSALAHIMAVCGRVNMIPLLLERRPQKTQHDGKSATHYPLFVNMDFRLADLQKLAQIDSTKILLSLPEPDEDKEDIMYAENTPHDEGAENKAVAEQLDMEVPGAKPVPGDDQLDMHVPETSIGAVTKESKPNPDWDIDIKLEFMLAYFVGEETGIEGFLATIRWLPKGAALPTLDAARIDYACRNWDAFLGNYNGYKLNRSRKEK